MPLQNQIEQYYRGSGRNFEDDVMYHILDENGIVHISPEHILLARAVSLEAPTARIINPAHHFLMDRCNAWHIHFLTGNPGSLLRKLEGLALRLPYLSFQRGDSRHLHNLRIYPAKRFLTLAPQLTTKI